MRTLKVISYRATHFLSFLIIIMVINVYKLKSLTPDERSAEIEIREQTLCTYMSLAQGDDTSNPPFPAGLSSLPLLPSVSPSSLLPGALLGTQRLELTKVRRSRAQDERLKLLTCMPSA